MNEIKAVIFDWARTLKNPDSNAEFPEAEKILSYCKSKGYRLGLASFVSKINSPDTTSADRQNEIDASLLRKYFEIALATDIDKDIIFEQIVKFFNLPHDQIVIVDDRVIRGVRFGNQNGIKTIWLQNGKFANELPNEETGQPTYTIKSLAELKKIL